MFIILVEEQHRAKRDMIGITIELTFSDRPHRSIPINTKAQFQAVFRNGPLVVRACVVPTLFLALLTTSPKNRKGEQIHFLNSNCKNLRFNLVFRSVELTLRRGSETIKR